MLSLLIPHILTYPTPKQPLTTPRTIITNKPTSILCFKSQNNEKHDHGGYKNSIVVPKKIVSLMRKEEEEENEIMKRKKLGMLLLCGVGYYVQGFRCFPWLALNFHMVHFLKLHPSSLQFVQNVGNLPMVVKPVYGLLSDALYICGAHRVPYISIGVLLQVLSWGPLAMAPFVGEALPTLMACVLLSNLGAGITEVAQDALVAEYGQKHSIVGLQSYTFMAIAVAGILGNSLGGIILSKSHPRIVLFIFTTLLFTQLLISLAMKEETLDLSKPSNPRFDQESLINNIKKQFSDLMVALSGETISHPLTWVVLSIAMVPLLTGSIFCFQTQFLNLDPSIIGMSKVIGQMMLLSLTVLYDRYWKNIPIRKLIKTVQILYASSLLLDLVLVNRINLIVGIPNDTFALFFAGLAETIATFKTIPFFVLIGSLCPPGCEASVTAFLASVLTLSSIISGFFGIGLASLLGITSGNYTNLPNGIVIQWLAALVPLFWINNLPNSPLVVEKERRKGRSKRSRRNRRVGRVVLKADLSYRRERESETQR